MEKQKIDPITLFKEYQNSWDDMFVKSSKKIFNEFFIDLDLPFECQIVIEIQDHNYGSVTIQAIISFIIQNYHFIEPFIPFVSMIIELPRFIENLMNLASKLDEEMKNQGSKLLYRLIREKYPEISDLPKNPVSAKFKIDPGPIAPLIRNYLNFYKINMNIVVSKDNFTLENLNDYPIKDVKIGIIVSNKPINNHNFEDYYQSSIPFLSPKQTSNKNYTEFVNGNGNQLVLPDSPLIFMDCWIEDNRGIHIIHFYIT